MGGRESEPGDVSASAATGADELQRDQTSAPGERPPESSSDIQMAETPERDVESDRRLWTGLLGWNDRRQGQSANQYLIGLKATYLALERDPDPIRERIRQELDRILKKYPDDLPIKDDREAWDDANRCETLLVHLYDQIRLDVELDRRILEAEQMKLDFASFYAGRRMKPATADAKLTVDQEKANRSLLARLIEDLQWHNNKLYLKRSYARTAQIRVSVAFLIALAIFGMTMISVFGTSEFLGVAVTSAEVRVSEDVQGQPGQNP
jgi:hypothetical protein